MPIILVKLVWLPAVANGRKWGSTNQVFQNRKTLSSLTIIEGNDSSQNQLHRDGRNFPNRFFLVVPNDQYGNGHWNQEHLFCKDLAIYLQRGSSLAAPLRSPRQWKSVLIRALSRKFHSWWGFTDLSRLRPTISTLKDSLMRSRWITLHADFVHNCSIIGHQSRQL